MTNSVASTKKGDERELECVENDQVELGKTCLSWATPTVAVAIRR